MKMQATATCVLKRSANASLVFTPSVCYTLSSDVADVSIVLFATYTLGECRSCEITRSAIEKPLTWLCSASMYSFIGYDVLQ